MLIAGISWLDAVVASLIVWKINDVPIQTCAVVEVYSIA